MSAKYIYRNLVSGGLIYNKVFKENSIWNKHKTEVDKILIENEHEHLIEEG